MARSKVPMDLISNEKKRKITFQNRKKSLIKKARELATLCNVEISMIICTDHQDPVIFHANHRHDFNNLCNVYVQNRTKAPEKNRLFGLSDFIDDKKVKNEEQVAKADKNREDEHPDGIDIVEDSSELGLRECSSGLEGQMTCVKNKVKDGGESSNRTTVMTVIDTDPETVNEETSKVFYRWL